MNWTGQLKLFAAPPPAPFLNFSPVPNSVKAFLDLSFQRLAIADH